MKDSDNISAAGNAKPETDPRRQRRALLGAISAAGVAGASKLPTQWTRPVVDHAVLPVHAQTTTEEPGGGATGTSASTFVTTITSDCAITCTSGYFAIFEPNSISTDAADFTNGYLTRCMDNLGGMSEISSVIGTGITSTQALTLTETFITSSTFSENAICNVTATSS